MSLDEKIRVIIKRSKCMEKEQGFKSIASKKL